LLVVVVRGLAGAARALVGEDPEAVCATLRRWSEHQQRELPWLAGPCLSAVHRAGVTVPSTGHLHVVQRFLVGAEAEPDTVLAAIDHCLAEVGDAGPELPPDARGALAAAVDRFFELLTSAYAQLHHPVRTGHRRDAEDVIALWQPRLDDAADDVDERAKVLTGQRQVAPPPSKPPRGTRDRPGCALVFVVLALLTAFLLVSAVLQGWPAQPVDFGL
jgi:hypothetical protein